MDPRDAAHYRALATGDVCQVKIQQRSAHAKGVESSQVEQLMYLLDSVNSYALYPYKPLKGENNSMNFSNTR